MSARIIQITVANAAKYSRETSIYVSTSSKLSAEQTRSVTDELLRIIGYSNDCGEFKFHFVDEGSLVHANASVDDKLRLSVND